MNNKQIELLTQYISITNFCVSQICNELFSKLRVATDFELSCTAPLFKETVVTEILSVFGGAEEWNTFLLVDYSTWIVLACGVTTYEHSTWHYYITSN